MFDEPRFLKLDLLSMSWIEDNVLNNGRALPISAIMGAISRVGFLRIVLQGALGMEHNNPRIKAEDIPAIVEAYIENTGNLTDLQDTLKEIYDLATKNPMKLAEEAKAKEKAKAKLEDPGGKK